MDRTTYIVRICALDCPSLRHWRSAITILSTEYLSRTSDYLIFLTSFSSTSQLTQQLVPSLSKGGRRLGRLSDSEIPVLQHPPSRRGTHKRNFEREFCTSTSHLHLTSARFSKLVVRGNGQAIYRHVPGALLMSNLSTAPSNRFFLCPVTIRIFFVYLYFVRCKVIDVHD